VISAPERLLVAADEGDGCYLLPAHSSFPDEGNPIQPCPPGHTLVAFQPSL
jgi:hypothetical protein